MSAKDGKCDRCDGTGKVLIPLFFSMVEDPCPLCKGDGKHIYMCDKCGKNRAIITQDLQGQRWRHPCKPCADKAARQSNMVNNVFTSTTYNISQPYYFGIK